MASPDTTTYLVALNENVGPVAGLVDEILESFGCRSYVKTIYIGYEMDGEVVAALYGHADHVELALALSEDAAGPLLQDASHLTWRTLPVSAIVRSLQDAECCRQLIRDAVERVAGGRHPVMRTNDFFAESRERRRAERRRST